MICPGSLTTSLRTKCSAFVTLAFGALLGVLPGQQPPQPLAAATGVPQSTPTTQLPTKSSAESKCDAIRLQSNPTWFGFDDTNPILTVGGPLFVLSWNREPWTAAIYEASSSSPVFGVSTASGFFVATEPTLERCSLFKRDANEKSGWNGPRLRLAPLISDMPAGAAGAATVELGLSPTGESSVIWSPTLDPDKYSSGGAIGQRAPSWSVANIVARNGDLKLSLPLRTIAGEPQKAQAIGGVAFSYSPSGGRLAVLLDDGSLQVWEPENAPLHPAVPAPSPASSVVVATSSLDAPEWLGDDRLATTRHLLPNPTAARVIDVLQFSAEGAGGVSTSQLSWPAPRPAPSAGGQRDARQVGEGLPSVNAASRVQLRTALAPNHVAAVGYLVADEGISDTTGSLEVADPKSSKLIGTIALPRGMELRRACFSRDIDSKWCALLLVGGSHPFVVTLPTTELLELASTGAELPLRISRTVPTQTLTRLIKDKELFRRFVNEIETYAEKEVANLPSFEDARLRMLPTIDVESRRKIADSAAVQHAAAEVAREFGTRGDLVLARWLDPKREDLGARSFSYGNGTFTLDVEMEYTFVDSSDTRRTNKNMRHGNPEQNQSWWKAAGVTERKNYLMALWAENDPGVQGLKIDHDKKCGGRSCDGGGEGDDKRRNVQRVRGTIPPTCEVCWGLGSIRTVTFR